MKHSPSFWIYYLFNPQTYKVGWGMPTSPLKTIFHQHLPFSVTVHISLRHILTKACREAAGKIQNGGQHVRHLGCRHRPQQRCNSQYLSILIEHIKGFLSKQNLCKILKIRQKLRDPSPYHVWGGGGDFADHRL